MIGASLTVGEAGAMDLSRRLVRARNAPPRQPERGRTRRVALLAAVVACAGLAGLLTGAAQAQAQERRVPLRLTVTVVPPSGIPGPRPAGTVRVAIDGRTLLSVGLVRGLAPLTAITPQLTVALEALGRRVTISYSGDSNYEASTGISLTLPTRNVLTIVARPRDMAAPAIEIRAPADGARYPRGAEVVANYACHDPGDRSAVTACDGPVASGRPLDTTSAGTFSFAVRGEDALGNATSATVTYEVTGDAAGPATPGSRDGASDDAPSGAPNSGASEDPSGAAPGGAPAAPPVAPPAATASAAPITALAPPIGVPPGATAAPAVTSSPTPRITPPGRQVAGVRVPPAPTAGASDVATPLRRQLAAYHPRDHPATTLGILVAAFTLLQLGAGTRGLAVARGAGGVARSGPEREDASKPKPDFVYDRLKVKFLGAGLGTVALGDRSRTWSWPGTRRLDAIGTTLPARLSRRSPLLARVAADGTYLRAILGSASLLGLLAGLLLGVAALHDTGGDALPPVATLTIAIAVLGVLDATAGLLAVLIFTSGVVLMGGVESGADLRVTLSLGALWFVVPVLAGATRPLRRPPTRSLGESWDRAADFVIGSLVGAWTVHQIILALPGMAGVQLPIADHADTAAFCVLAALVVRLAAETIASHLYPRRLDVSEPAIVPDLGAFQRLAASALRTAMFVFFAYIVTGTGWQLWVGAALFLAPQILFVYRERLPNSPGLFRARPRGLLRLVVMLFLASALAALLLRTMDERDDTFLADSFVVLALPGFLIGLLPIFGREGPEPSLGWGKRIAGIAILVAGVLLALGLLL
jgi:hypothetical protein